MALIVDFPQGQRFSSSQRNERPRSSSVSFEDHSTVQIVENLIIQHKADLWFTKGEMHDFKLHTAKLVQSIKSRNSSVARFAELNTADTSVFLGLENYLSEATPREIVRRRRILKGAVLLEQKRQRDEFVWNPEVLSGLSERLSEVSRQRARIIALLHADNKKPTDIDSSFSNFAKTF